MATPGPAPTHRTEGRSDVTDWIDVPNVPFVAGRERTCPVGDPHPLTERWWNTIREMPHAAIWNEADWVFAEDLATIKDRFYKGDLSDTGLAEMRRREDQIGTTVEARRKIRVRYVQPKVRPEDHNTAQRAAAGGSNVTPIAARRSRLLDD